MISIIHPLAVGNAARIVLIPPVGTHSLKLLRRQDQNFAGPSDPEAVIVYSGRERSILDVHGLMNDETVHYKAFYFSQSGALLAQSQTIQTIIHDTFSDLSTDPLTVVRDRLELGFASLIKRGKLSHELGHIPVMTASPLFEETVFPVVTVHMSSDRAQARAIGEDIDLDGWYEGWLSSVRLTILAWSLNSDERIELRKSLKSIVMSNLEVFDSAGLMQIELEVSDQDDFQTYAAPIYQAVGTLSCVCPSVADVDNYPVINTVIPTVRSF